MPLSEEEQRLLEQMEQALAADDPKFASTLRGTSLRARLRRQVVLSAVAFLVGTALLLLGVILPVIAVSVGGFVVMLASAYLLVTAWKRGGEVGNDQAAPAAGPERPGRTAARPPRASSHGSFMNRMEERWRRRRDDGM